MELYKKFRPPTLSKIVGNEATIKSLSKKIENKTLPHFIMLSGPSGCGKTTIARIIKKELDCSDMDFYEINCANRTGVDLARDIERRFRQKSINGTCRIWLLDECHKMTAACAESLLKPLEDTPDHVYFIFATTDPQKVLKTIKTRATEYRVSALKEPQIQKLLKRVVRKEKMEVPDEVLDKIAEHCLGSARMALVILDKVRGLNEEEMLEVVEQSVKEETQAFELLKVLFGWDRGKWKSAAPVLKNLEQDAEGVRRYILACASNQLMDYSKAKNHEQAFHILNCFDKNFYDTGKPGLVAACYDAVFGEGSVL